MPSRIAFSTLAFPDATLAAAASAGRRWGYSASNCQHLDLLAAWLESGQ